MLAIQQRNCDERAHYLRRSPHFRLRFRSRRTRRAKGQNLPQISSGEAWKEGGRTRSRSWACDLQDDHRGTPGADLGPGQSEWGQRVLICIASGGQRRGSPMRTNRLAVFIFGALLIVLGCHRRVPLTTLPPAPPAPTPAAAPPSPAAVALDDAERAFSAGGYDEASRNYENYLRLNPAGGPRDQVLFRLGLAYALRPAADWPRASRSEEHTSELQS